MNNQFWSIPLLLIFLSFLILFLIYLSHLSFFLWHFISASIAFLNIYFLIQKSLKLYLTLLMYFFLFLILLTPFYIIYLLFNIVFKFINSSLNFLIIAILTLRYSSLYTLGFHFLYHHILFYLLILAV